MNDWLRENLVCPRDKQKLQTKDNNLICPENHVYPIVEDIPIMLLEEEEHIHGYITQTLENVAKMKVSGGFDDQFSPSENGENAVDPFVQSEIPYTCGNLYMPLLHKLTRYPIPEIRVPQGNGEKMLDVGCNWGRWSIAAAQLNYRPVGIDPSLFAVLAARRISKQLNVAADFVVGDARRLPFADGCFDVGFSYGVFQHFSKENAKTSLEEVARTVKKDGKIVMQMPNKFGVRSIYQQVRRGFSEGAGFDVRYWSPSEIMETFKKTFGETTMTADCYFGLGIQNRDIDLIPPRFKLVVRSSEFMRRMSHKISSLISVADSVYLDSVNQNK